MSDIASWLDQHGLGKYAQVLLDNDVDFDVLAEVTEDDLNDFGLSFGDRKRFLKLVREHSEELNAPREPGQLAKAQSVQSAAERRQLTVMFCDLVGSTALSESMDAEDYREVLAAYQGAASAAIKAQDGYIARYMGDGLLVYFGYPNAQENDPERATRAGLEVIDAVSALQVGPRLEVRIGIATGPVVVGDIIGEGASEEAAVLGETPNLAARLQGAAAPNTVLLSPTTQQLLKGRIETEALEPVKLSGLSRSIAAHRALRARSLSDVSETQLDSSPLVGRDVEVALLERAWQHAQSLEGQAVLLSGDAGVGKSRLLRAFQATVAEDGRTRVQWHCSPYYQTTAHFPAIDQLKRSMSLDEQDAGNGLSRLRTMVSHLGLDQQDLVPILALLLGVPMDGPHAMADYSPDEIKRRLISAQVELLLAAAKQAPLLFIIEDLHWADPTTVEVLREMVAAIRDKSVLILMTARPEFRPPWSEQSNAMAHRLSSLTRSETMALVRGLAQGHGLNPEFVERIVERTDGVPLFIEELTQSLLESGGDVGVPTSLQDSLMARLDRLGDGKELAQMAAVIGRTFSIDALNALAELSSEAVEQRLIQVVDSGLVRRRTSGEYEFKHALIRDAAYDSMLRNTRRRLHGRYAEHLQANGTGERQPELLAQQYAEAGHADQAIDYWTRAGDSALMHAAQSEAAAHFQRALELIGSLDPSVRNSSEELAVLLRLGQAQLGGFGGAAPQTIETFARAAELAKDHGSLADTCRALYGRRVGLLISGRTVETLDAARDFERLAHESGDEWVLAVANRLSGGTQYIMGQLHEARKSLLHVLASRDILDQGPGGFGHDPYFTAVSTLMHVEWALGYPQTAIDRSVEHLLAMDRKVLNSNSVSLALVWHLLLALWCRRQDLAADTVDKLEHHTRRSGGRFWEYMCMWGKGACLIRSGEPREGLKILEQGHRGFVETGALQHVPFALILAAEGHLVFGDIRRCLVLLSEADELVAQTSQRFYEAEIHRLRGAALVVDGKIEAAQASYQRALLVARSQDSKSWELRAAIGLAQLWVGLGKRDEALDLLAPIYNWFEQGHDLPDLLDAKRVLEQLERA